MSASILRSEDMVLCELIIESQIDIAYKSIAALGNLECVQFLNVCQFYLFIYLFIFYY